MPRVRPACGTTRARPGSICEAARIHSYETHRVAFTDTMKSRPVLLGTVLLAIGAILAVGGFILAWLGGSWYYIITGIAVLLSGVLLWRGDRRAPWLYAAMLVWTVIWSLFESGMDGWALAPRILPPLVLGLWF